MPQPRQPSINLENLSAKEAINLAFNQLLSNRYSCTLNSDGFFELSAEKGSSFISHPSIMQLLQTTGVVELKKNSQTDFTILNFKKLIDVLTNPLNFIESARKANQISNADVGFLKNNISVFKRISSWLRFFLPHDTLHTPEQFQNLFEEKNQTALGDSKTPNTEAKTSLYTTGVKSFDRSWKTDPQDWATYWGAVTQEAAKKLMESKEPLTAKSFYDFLGKKRAEAAEHFGHNDKAEDKETHEFITGCYGVSRSLDQAQGLFAIYSECLEPGHGRYADAYNFYSNRHDQRYANPDKDEKQNTTSCGAGRHDNAKYYFTAVTTYGNFVKADGTRYQSPYITVSKVKLEGRFGAAKKSKTPEETSKERKYYPGGTTEYIVNAKMPSHRIEDFYRAIEPLFQDVLQWKGTDPKDFYQRLGLLFWHLAVAMPMRLGSGAALLAMMRSFEMAKGFPPLDFHEGITPEFRAYYSNPDEFAKGFYDLRKNNTEYKDPFAVEPTQARQQQQRIWDDIRSASERKLYTADTDELVSFPYPDSPYPLFQYHGMPESDKHPSPFRPPMQRIFINWNGSEDCQQKMQLLVEQWVAELEMQHVAQDKLEILKKPGGFEALYLYLKNDFYNISLHSAATIAQYLKESSLESLEEIRIKHIKEEEVISWLESLPPEQSRKMHRMIGTRENITDTSALNKHILDEIRTLILHSGIANGFGTTPLDHVIMQIVSLEKRVPLEAKDLQIIRDLIPPPIKRNSSAGFFPASTDVELQKLYTKIKEALEFKLPQQQERLKPR